jgi:isoleucyl-tRNA synthetase
MYQNLIVSAVPVLPDSVHLTAWPAADMAAHRDLRLESAMSVIRRAVDLARTLRSQAGLRVRQPLARVWLALPEADLVGETELLDLLRDELNVHEVAVIGDGSELIDRRVKPLLPKIGKRLGSAIPQVMAAARAGEFTIREDGSVELGGQVLAADEVEIQATPRPGTAVASDEGLVVVIDTEITPELRAEGDARELTRAIQDLRKQAGLDLDELIELYLVAPGFLLDPIRPHVDEIRRDTLAQSVGLADTSTTDGVLSATQEISGGTVTLALRGLGGKQ